MELASSHDLQAKSKLGSRPRELILLQESHFPIWTQRIFLGIPQKDGVQPAEATDRFMNGCYRAMIFPLALRGWNRVIPAPNALAPESMQLEERFIFVSKTAEK